MSTKRKRSSSPSEPRQTLPSEPHNTLLPSEPHNTLLPSEPQNTVIFTIARMNPPTPGHIHLIAEMMKLAIDNNVREINIILSATVDNTKNPLFCNEKREILNKYAIEQAKEQAKEEVKREKPDNEEFVDQINVNIICLDDPIEDDSTKYPIPAKVRYMLKKYADVRSKYADVRSKVILVVGEDREKHYNFLGKILETPNYEFSIVFIDRPADAMSATKIRKFATENTEYSKKQFDEYMSFIPSYEKNKLYEDLRSRLINPETQSKQTNRKKQTKKGGKKRKVKRIKRSRKVNKVV